MTEFTPARLTELKAVAEAQVAAHKRMIELNGGVGMLGVRHPQMFDDMLAWDGTTGNEHADTVLALIDALEAKTDEVEGYKQSFPCDGGCSYNDGPQEECSLHGRNPSDLWEVIGGLIKQRDEARTTAENHVLDADATYVRMAEKLEQVKRERDEARAAKRSINTYLRLEREAARQNLHRAEKAERERDEARTEAEELRAWQAQTVRRVRDSVAGEHYAMLVVEDIPNADFGELIDRLKRQRVEARAALKAKDSYACDLEEQLQHIKSLWRATGRAEADAHRRADRAEAAIEWVRIAATEVTKQENNHGRTHYEGCWKYHLHCLAAKIIYETGADDD